MKILVTGPKGFVGARIMSTVHEALPAPSLRTADEDREVSPAELKKFFIANEYKKKWEKAESDAQKTDVDKGAIKKFCEKEGDSI